MGNIKLVGLGEKAISMIPGPGHSLHTYNPQKLNVGLRRFKPVTLPLRTPMSI